MTIFKYFKHVLLAWFYLFSYTTVNGQTVLSLNQAVDLYLSSTPQSEATHFNNMMKSLTKGCSNESNFAKIKNGIDPEISDISELFDFQCISNKIFSLSDPEKIKILLDKIVSFPLSSNFTPCLSDSACSGEKSCLPFTEDDFSIVLGDKGELINAIKNIDEETTQNKGIALKSINESCQFNYECQSLSCYKPQVSSPGVCKNLNYCRLGRNLERVKGDNGGCEEGIEKNQNNICMSKLTDDNLPKLYNDLKLNLEKKVCGEFDGGVGDTVALFAKDLRAFELMMLLSQNLQQDLNRYKGANRYHYHQLPKRVKELFLTQYLEDKKTHIKKFNDSFKDFTKNFTNVLNSDGKSTDQVNFFDITVIQKEMHSQKETANYYLALYQHWIKTQQQFHRDTAHLMLQHMVTDNSETSGFMAVLHALGRTTANSDKAPLFNNSEGKKNKKRWFLALSLPKNQNDFKYFYDSNYIEKSELDLAGFKAKNSARENLNPFSSSNWYWNVASVATPGAPITKVSIPALNAVIVGSRSKKAQLLDPLLPPNGCKIIDNTSNECGSENDSTRDWFTGTNGKFEKDINTTLEKLHNAWFESVINYYKELAQKVPANYIIDPELNIYAGCVQQGNFPIKQNTSNTNSQENVSEFFKNFCFPDSNKDGVISGDEYKKSTEYLLKQLAKKILTFSLAYSYNANKRPVTAGVSNSYQDEFAKDESTTLAKKPEWIDPSIREIDPATKFYNFKLGNKKRFLNRIHNKYFFLTQMYYLLGNNFDKQIKCLTESGGGFENGNIVDNSVSPTATPQFIPTSRNNNSGSNNGGVNSGSTNGGNGQNSGGNNNQYRANDQSSGTSTQLAFSSGSSGNLNNGFAAQKTQNIEDTSQNSNEEGKKSLVLDGVAQKAGTGSDSTLTDKKGNVPEYNFGSFDGAANSGQAGGEVGGVNLSQQEQEKVQAALNSNQDPQFSDEDTLFTQITKRYIKNYRTIFRSERRSSAQ